MTLTEFLLARIAEDEGKIHGDWSDGRGLHIITEEMFDRMLAECEAKRRIVGIHELDPIEVYSWGTTGGGCGLCDHSCETGGDTWGHDPCETLKALALPYADHPDYRQEWKP